MIRVQVISDIHSEFGRHALPSAQDLKTEADVVVLAGDIARAPDSVNVACRLFSGDQPIVLVGGNHEHYKTGLTIDQGVELMRKAAAEELRVHFLENEELILPIRGTALRVIGATFWTDFALNGNVEADSEVCRRVVNDHRAIAGSTGRRFLPGEAIRRHRASSGFLSDKLDQLHEGPTIVVTHHLPSIRSVSKRFLVQFPLRSPPMLTNSCPVVPLSGSTVIHMTVRDGAMRMEHSWFVIQQAMFSAMEPEKTQNFNLACVWI